MAKWIQILILIVLGFLVVGYLWGFSLFNIFQRIHKKRQNLFQKKPNLITTGPSKQPVATTLKVALNKPDGQKEDALEILFKNHNNMVTSENNRKYPKPNVPEELEIIKDHNISLVKEQKQSSEPSVFNASEIINHRNITIEGAPAESSKPNAPRGQTIADHKNIPNSESQMESHRQVILKGPEITNPKIPLTEVRQNESPQSDIIQELEANLAIATTPWANKLLPFHTSYWDSKRAEDEPTLSPHIQDLIQLHVDVGLANNIVWLATEFGHRSKELDESYIKLCANIAERLKRIVPSLNRTI